MHSASMVMLVGSEVSITYSSLAKLESRVNKNPTVRTLQKIANALEVSLDDLMEE